VIIVMQIWDGDKEKAVETSARLKEAYPSFFLGILANNCAYPKEIEKYADLIHSTAEDVFAVGTGGLAAHELFALGLKMPGDIIVKIDADTKINKIVNISDASFARRLGVFGKMQVATGGNPPSVHKSINGGALGIRRNTARAFVDEEILLSNALVTLDQSKVSAYIREKFENRQNRTMLSSHDWSVAWACEHLNVPMERDSLLVSAFEHEVRLSKPKPLPYPLPSPRVSNSSLTSQLKEELLYDSKRRTAEIASFIRDIWGDDGILISKKDYETGHVITREFTDLSEAVAFIEFRDSLDMAVTARPWRKDGSLQMIVLDTDVPCENITDVSLLKTSYGRSHLYMLMEPAVTKQEAEAVVSSATFANSVRSMSATFMGCRVPGTTSYSRECLLIDGDNCKAIRKPNGVVELSRRIDRYFSVEEISGILSQLSKAYKVRPPVTEPEPALL